MKIIFISYTIFFRNELASSINWTSLSIG